MFNELARELGRDDITKAPENDRARLLIAALKGTRTLLLLDNLESLVKGEHGTLLGFVTRLPQGCKALLTSRVLLGTRAEELSLGSLSEEAALQTLQDLARHNTKLATANDEDFRTLYHETRGIPLLLRWTAGQVGLGTCITVADAIRYLHSCPDGNDPLEFIFGHLADAFTETDTNVLCTLTHFTLPAKAEHIAPVLACPEVDVEKTLRSLANRSLMLHNLEQQTYTLVPLAGDFLRKKKKKAVDDRGIQLEAYVYDLVKENGYAKYDRFPTLDAAWPTVAAAVPRWAE